MYAACAWSIQTAACVPCRTCESRQKGNAPQTALVSTRSHPFKHPCQGGQGNTSNWITCKRRTCRTGPRRAPPRVIPNTSVLQGSREKHLCLHHLEEKNLPNWPEEGSSPSSPCTLAHFSFPEGSRRQVSMALTVGRGKRCNEQRAGVDVWGVGCRGVMLACVGGGPDAAGRCQTRSLWGGSEGSMHSVRKKQLLQCVEGGPDAPGRC